MNLTRKIIFAVCWSLTTIIWLWVVFQMVRLHFSDLPGFSGTSHGLFLTGLWMVIGLLHIRFYRIIIRL